MSRRPVRRVSGSAPRHGYGGRLGTLALILGLSLGVAGLPARAQDAPSPDNATAQARATEEKGYARIVFRFDKLPEYRATLSNGILVLKFSQPVTVPVDRLALSIANYVTAARRDPDGMAMRFALSRRVTVRTMAAGERLFIDLLPETWAGEPPALPDDVIEELNARAKEAERLAAEEAARRALAKPTPIEIRAAEQPTFARITFDLTSPVPVSLERKGDVVRVVFDAALTADPRPIKSQMPPQLKDISVADKDARLAVTLRIAKSADVRAFWDGPQYIIDLTGAGDAASAEDLAAKIEAAAKANAEPPAGETVLRGEATPGVTPPPTVPADHGAATDAPAHGKPEDATQAVKPPEGKASGEHSATEAPAAEPKPAKPADAHAAAEPAPAAEAGHSAEKPSPEHAAAPAEPTPTPAKEAAADHAADPAPHGEVKTADTSPAKPAEPLSKTAEAPHGAAPGEAAHASEPGKGGEAVPVVAAAGEGGSDPVGDVVRPIVQTIGETVRIAFPFERKTSAAVYRRGENLWIVFGSERAIDAAPIAAQGGSAISAADSFMSDGARVLKISLKKTPLTTVSTDANTWIVSVGDVILDAAVQVPLVRGVRPNGRTMIVAPLEGVGTVHRIKDPDVGDEVIAVTASAPARAFLKPQEFVEFRTLVTAHGLAFLAKADDVVVQPEIDRVIISRDSGLTLSADARPTAAATKGPEKRIALMDTAQWDKEIAQPFRERERELLHAVAAATDREATPARISLARFYLAKGFGAEAAGTLRLALSADPNVARDPEFTILQSAAYIALRRGAEAVKLLADNGLSDSADGALWRALAQSADNQWGPAREAYQKGIAALDLYPPSLQAPFRLVGYQAALEAGDAADAETNRKALEELGGEAANGPRVALLNARLAEMEGRSAEALETYRVAIDGPDAVSSAEARLRAISLRRTLGQVEDKAVLDELETLASIWRGDDIEARTLKGLAEEHLKAGRYRDAFTQLKIALRYHPDAPSTRTLQDELTDKFVALFLDGEADKMPPIDALALFYDYRELTPVDRRGDEMIRKLADRLVEVDLLDQAGELLQHQIDNRLSGAGRAQVAAQLAMIQLMNRKPAQALRTIATTRQAGLPRELTRIRLILEARALAETARSDMALEILDQVDGDESARLRADVLWQSRRWRDAGEAIETLLGNAWEGAAPLSDDQRLQALRAAIAYSLAEDKIGLDRLRTKYTAKMANSADASAFETVSAPIEARGTAFRDIAKAIASSDTLDAFMKDFRARHGQSSKPTGEAAPAGTKPSASTGTAPPAG